MFMLFQYQTLGSVSLVCFLFGKPQDYITGKAINIQSLRRLPLMLSSCILKRDRNMWLIIKLKSEKESGGGGATGCSPPRYVGGGGSGKECLEDSLLSQVIEIA